MEFIFQACWNAWTKNAYAVLDQRVQSRAGYLEDDMVRRWSNLSLTQEVLGELYEGLVQDGSVTPGELASDPASTTRFWNRQRRNSSL